MNKIISLVFGLVLISNTNISAQSVSELFEKLDSSVVIIQVVESKTTGKGDVKEKVAFGALGSGVLIDKEGHILTAAHVVNNADEIQIIFKDGQVLKAKVEGLSRIADIAIIKTMGLIKNPKPAKLGDSDKTKIGEQVMVIGSPMGLYHSLSVGYISRKESGGHHKSNFSDMEFFQTDAAINTGNSGGPMFNMQGEVIGIVSSILSRSGGFEGIGFAATINIIKELLIDHGNTWLGIDAFLLQPPLIHAFNVPQEAGILVQNVTKDSPAYFMGMKGGYINALIGEHQLTIGGDIILSIDDVKLDNEKQIKKAINHLNSMSKGQKYRISVLRNGEIKELHWSIK